jgi:hypothetical protein
MCSNCLHCAADNSQRVGACYRLIGGHRSGTMNGIIVLRRHLRGVSPKRKLTCMTPRLPIFSITAIDGALTDADRIATFFFAKVERTAAQRFLYWRIQPTALEGDFCAALAELPHDRLNRSTT